MDYFQWFFKFQVTDPISALGFNDFSYQATLIGDQNKALNAKWVNYTYTNAQELNSGTHTKEYDTTGKSSFPAHFFYVFLIKHSSGLKWANAEYD